MGVMAGFTVDVGLSMFARAPFVRRGFMTGGAQCIVRRNGHGVLWMSQLHWPVTGFTGYAFFRILPAFGIISRCMALETGCGRALLGPVLLENGR